MTSSSTAHGYWAQCLGVLRQSLTTQEHGLWLAPLQIEEHIGQLTIYCPNQYVKRFVEDKCISLLEDVKKHLSLHIRVCIGVKNDMPSAIESVAPSITRSSHPIDEVESWSSRLNASFTFDQYVPGVSNQMAYSAAQLVTNHPGKSYNPLVLYGDVGLGKTHLMQAIGHALAGSHTIRYIHSERFVSMMVRALQNHSMQQFKDSFRSISLLLLDDIQFFVNKERSQEELFHVMNALLDSGVQMVVTCDRFPKELEGLAERLKSRFSCGLTVGIDPPDLETRVAILMQKASLSSIALPEAVAFFIAERISGNVRELEGALKRLIANAFFTSEPITVPFAQNALRDLLQMHARLINIDSIQKIVAKHYKIKMADLVGMSRKQTLVMSRQIAMFLIKELTGHSLPEIGAAFGGRDHTTVLHAVRKIRTMSVVDGQVKQDIDTLMRMLS